MPTQLSQKQILILAGIGGLIVLVVLVFIFGGSSSQKTAAVSLKIWGYDQNTDSWDKIISDYKAFRPNVDVEYQSFDPASYGSALLNALASGKGPDVFMINNHELLENKDKITPLNSPNFGLSQMDIFPDVVSQDFVSDDTIYALPLNMDTLALFYNNDLFNSAAVVQPPPAWDNVESLVSVFKNIDKNTGQINQAAVALGGSMTTIINSPDILSALMLQYGTKMIDLSQGYRAIFNEGQGDQTPGLNAFNFYLNFSSPKSSDYTWNDNQPDSFDSFASGKTAMVFGYYKDIASIKNKSAFLNFKIAPLPQKNLKQPVNFASYNGLVVSRQSRKAAWAWDFITFLTTSEDEEGPYLEAQGELPALRSLIAKKINDPQTAVFNRQALTAKDWPIINYSLTKTIFSNAIKNVLSGLLNSQTALDQAANQITQLGATQ